MVGYGLATLDFLFNSLEGILSERNKMQHVTCFCNMD